MEPNTFVCRLTSDERTARRIADVLSETFENGTAVTAFERSDGVWSLEALFVRRPDEEAVRDIIGLVIGVDAARTTVFETLPTRDWVEASLAALTPITAGRFVIHGAHDRANIVPNRIAIEIEAALAFGTGHHGTTRGCLLALDALAKTVRPRRVLDIGTGSGILAIAAAKALRAPTVASDIDGNAVDVATANARLNGVASSIRFVYAAGVGARAIGKRAPYDLIFANILLQPIKRLAAPLARLISARGRIVLSGLLASQANAAMAAYRAQGLSLERSIALEGWVTLVMHRARLGAGPP